MEVGETLDIALRNSDRLAALINDVLDVSKIETGNLNFVMETIEVKALVALAVEATRAYGLSVGVAIVARDVVPDAWLEADKGRLMQVFANLLSNAVKFSPEGSTVVVSAFREAGKVQFVVTDNGCGIPKSFRQKVFERSAQADMSDSRKAGGSGLGLSIAKAIVECHPGGSIGFLSKRKRGQRSFLPCRNSSEEAVQPRGNRALRWGGEIKNSVDRQRIYGCWRSAVCGAASLGSLAISRISFLRTAS